MIHGHLTGVCDAQMNLHYVLTDKLQANILIDGNGKALLADFGVFAINGQFTSTHDDSPVVPDAVRWQAPELVVNGVAP